MGIIVGSNFDISAAIAIDSRTIRSQYSDLASVPNKFNGLEVFTTSDNKKYRYQSDAWVDLSAVNSDHKHSVLYQPDGTNGFVYTDNSGQLHIDGNIIQNGSAYETHAEQIYTKDDYIILRDGAIAGLATNAYVGFKAKLYDGVNDGHLVFDKNGVARVGDAGSEQPIATRIENPTNGHFAYWDNANTRLAFKALQVTDIPALNYLPIAGGSLSGNLYGPYCYFESSYSTYCYVNVDGSGDDSSDLLSLYKYEYGGQGSTSDACMKVESYAEDGVYYTWFKLTTRANDASSEVFMEANSQIRISTGSYFVIDANSGLLINSLANSAQAYVLSWSPISKTVSYCTMPSSIGYPASGIPNSTGTAWGTSYTTTGTGTIIALRTDPQFLGTPSIRNASGASSILGLYSGSYQRWGIGKTADVESTGNAGSNFAIYLYDDSGAYLSKPLEIIRSTGLVNLANDLKVSNKIYVSSGGADAIPSLLTTLVTGEIWGGSGTGDRGFLRLSAGGGSAVTVKAAIDIQGYSATAANSSLIRFMTGGNNVRMSIDNLGAVVIANSLKVGTLGGFVFASNGLLSTASISFEHNLSETLDLYDATAGSLLYKDANQGVWTYLARGTNNKVLMVIDEQDYNCGIGWVNMNDVIEPYYFYQVSSNAITVSLNKQIINIYTSSITASMTINLNNLIAGCECDIRITVTSGTPTITLSSSGVTFKGNGTLTLGAGIYHLCLKVISSTTVDWNIAKYV